MVERRTVPSRAVAKRAVAKPAVAKQDVASPKKGTAKYSKQKNTKSKEKPTMAKKRQSGKSNWGNWTGNKTEKTIEERVAAKVHELTQQKEQELLEERRRRCEANSMSVQTDIFLLQWDAPVAAQQLYERVVATLGTSTESPERRPNSQSSGSD
eukprot:TRINITY_DN79137_c0_g1_i1.p1 TRINITY_DN79137_c0_g1~~TRINITY_DN79137_c0_g1_i1.p1  ORF type:complete len:154 (+),score=46.70 TRINITY_DN79137_c0_g1_i1:113-574(+)